MNLELHRQLLAALERPHRLGTIGGDLEEQLVHCTSFSSVLEQVVSPDQLWRGVDLGTGGGLPGVVLAAVWPLSRWILTELRTARAVEVERVALRLGLGDRVRVFAGHAQQLGHEPHARGSYDVVVARSFGAASLAAECAAPLLRVGGRLIVSEPPTRDGSRWNVLGLAELGLSAPDPVLQAGTRFALMTKVGPTPDAYPRRPARADRGWPVADVSRGT